MPEAVKEKQGFFARIGKFFKDFRSEIKKISWATREDVMHNTVVVLVVIAIIGVLIWVLDWLFGTGITMILEMGLK